jgi:hypothetical protein
MPRKCRTVDDRVLQILSTMRTQGMSLVSFLEAYFGSKNHRIKSRVGWFYKHGGFTRVFHDMVQSTKYAGNKGATSASTAEASKTLQGDMLQLVLRVLREEMKAVAKDPRARVDPNKISPIACVDFSFTEMQKLYEEKSPIL